MDNRNYNHGDYNQNKEHTRGGRVLFGIAIALIGVALLLHTFGMFSFNIYHSWPVILIILGVLSALKNGFRNNGWWILILVGVANLIPEFKIGDNNTSEDLIWPALIVIVGLMIAIRPKRKKCQPIQSINSQVTSDSRLLVDVAFGGGKEIVTAKDFKGGTISVAFGGSEINMSQADFTSESVILDCRVTCGGVELVIPSNWEVRNEIRATLGSVEDARVIHAATPGEARKILILQGSCTCGGIEIKSY